MRHQLASLDSVASAADGTQKDKRFKTSCLCRDSNQDLSQQPGSTLSSRRFNPTSKLIALTPSAKQAQLIKHKKGFFYVIY